MDEEIESARNIGPAMGGALREVGVATGYLHLMCGYALLGAIENLDCIRLPEAQRRQVKRFKREIQRDLRNRA